MRLRHRPRPFAAPVGTHHRIPTDQTFTRPHPTVKDPQDPPQAPEVPVLSAATLAPLPAREPGANWPPPGADPAPVVTEVRLNRSILTGLRWDYANLPLFREGVEDKFHLHQLAMRAPRTTKTGGKVA